MRFVVTGAKGMLGQALCRRIRKQGDDVFELDLPQLDITNAEGVQRCILEAQPDWVLHCAAYTRVDDCEKDENYTLAARVNIDGTRNVARAANAAGAALLVMSTDYIFDGSKSEAYREDDPAHPINRYGLTKWQAEQAAQAHCPRSIVLRSSWLYGTGGSNFVSTIRSLALAGREIRVVNDQIGAPTYVEDLTKGILALTAQRYQGIYHMTNSGSTSWFDFATLLLARCGIVPQSLSPVSSPEYGSPAVRPHNSRLSNEKLKQDCGIVLPPYTEALDAFLKSQGWLAKNH